VLFPNPRRPDPEPLQGDPQRVVLVGTVLFGVALLALLPFRAGLVEDGRGWLLWSCVAGIVLGVIGYVATRRDRRAASGPAVPGQLEPPVARPNPAPGKSRPPRR
jgi:hypothetical protein